MKDMISETLNHASIVDRCLMVEAEILCFGHNDMLALGERLKKIPSGVAKLVVADAVLIRCNYI